MSQEPTSFAHTHARTRLAFHRCNLAFALERRQRKRQQPLAVRAMCRPLGDWFARRGTWKTVGGGGEGVCVHGMRDGCGSRIIRKGEKYLLCFLVNTNCIISSAGPCSPRLHRGHQTSAVTCQSSPDRRWPCTALLETIWIDLAFLICFRCWFPWQLACERGAMPNKIGLIGAQISWFYRVGAWGAESKNVQGFFFSIELSLPLRLCLTAQCFWQLLTLSNNGSDPRQRHTT